MRKLVLKNFGPINSCKIDIDNFTVLTGPQAAGKSTIAKAVAFFRTIKDDFCECIIRQQTTNTIASLNRIISTQMRQKFLQLFGSSRAMDNDMHMEYYYDDNTSISVNLQMAEGDNYISPNYIHIEFSENILSYLQQNHDFKQKETVVSELNRLFNDDFETIFIPAGRNLITLLTDQMNYLFTMMDEEQKRRIDYCTQKYVERILRIRPFFNSGIDGYLALKGRVNTGVEIKKCISLANEILKGRYVFESGEEKLYLNGKANRYVKINFTSSGQQEIVWLINILLYQLVNETKTFVIIEEPEAHLYPDAQKNISEIISVFAGKHNAAFVTTHSPYVLGSINNMLFANSIFKQGGNSSQKLVKSIIDQAVWLEKCSAFYVSQGKVSSCLERNGILIKNEVIDGASDKINNDFERLFEIGEL